MSIVEFDNEEEMDAEFERIASLNFEYLELKEEVKDKRKDLEYAEDELKQFEEENKQELLL